MRIYDPILDLEYPSTVLYNAAQYNVTSTPNPNGTFSIVMHPMLLTHLHKHVERVKQAVTGSEVHLNVIAERYAFACGELYGMACRLMNPKHAHELFDVLPDSGEGLPHGKCELLLADSGVVLRQGQSVQHLQLRLEPVYRDEARCMSGTPIQGVMQLYVGAYTEPAENDTPLLKERM